MRKLLCLISLCVTSCSSSLLTTPPVSINTAISDVQKDMIRTQTMPLSDYRDWSLTRKSKFTADIKNEQCAQKSQDPILPVITGPVVMSLQGTFSKTGGFSVTGITSGSLFGALSISGSSTKALGQGLSVPVTFTALSTLPSVEAMMEAQRLSLIISNHGGNSKVDDPVMTDILDERNQFKTFISALIQNYTPSQCVGTVFPITNYLGGRSPFTKH